MGRVGSGRLLERRIALRINAKRCVLRRSKKPWTGCWEAGWLIGSRLEMWAVGWGPIDNKRRIGMAEAYFGALGGLRKGQEECRRKSIQWLERYDRHPRRLLELTVNVLGVVIALVGLISGFSAHAAPWQRAVTSWTARPAVHDTLLRWCTGRLALTAAVGRCWNARVVRTVGQAAWSREVVLSRQQDLECAFIHAHPEPSFVLKRLVDQTSGTVVRPSKVCMTYD